MRELITRLFRGFVVDGTVVPVKFLTYQGHDEPYVVWMHTESDASFSCDDRLEAYVDYYDFDVYSKGDYTNIIEQIKLILEDNGFVFQPSRVSADMYETETGYYHKTLSFAIYKEN